ncbi:MAG: hypothetical protein WBA97_03035 [Actinophytocola sp.]|uniref:hypothetical protein n=1 Tax=Actinophytocola sp. TaxID=1872138 RepID=UPI003C73DEDE
MRALLVLAVLAAGLFAPAPAAAAPHYAGHVFLCFAGEGTAEGEQVSLAASRGNDPLKWDERNGGRPVLTSSLGEFGGRGYVPFTSADLASGDWRLETSYELPVRPRHGTVLPVTQSELDGVRAAYP